VVESGDAGLPGSDGGDNEVCRIEVSMMVVVVWSNWSQVLAEGRLEGGGVCGDAGSIAAA
jgi:hypothetical protein